MTSRPIIALDADGVLLDYNQGYAKAWHQAFGVRPGVRNAFGYGPRDLWDVPELDAQGRAQLRAHFDSRFWSSVPALPRAVEAAVRLHDEGFSLVCVTALDSAFEADRLRNLRDHGYPIERVYTTPQADGPRSPKADRVASLAAIAFVDDYAPYLRGIPPEVHTALITRGAKGGPNSGPDLVWANTVHHDLAEFAAYWLGRGAANSGGRL